MINTKVHVFFLRTSILFTVLLTACSTPPQPPEPKLPNIVRYETTADPAHIRDASVEYKEDHRGGAAIRQMQWHHVLWSSHREGMATRAKSVVPDAQEQQKKDWSIYSTQGKDESIYASPKK